MTEAFLGDGAIFLHPLIKYYVATVLVAIPCCRILWRFGLDESRALLLAVPYVGFVLLCIYIAVAGRRAGGQAA